MRCTNTFTSLLIGLTISLCVTHAPAIAGWHIETVDSEGLAGGYSSLAFDPSGNPAISYQGGGNLAYARLDGSSWVKTSVDLAESRRQFPTKHAKGEYTSLAFDPSGNPAISYYDTTTSALRYARFNGSSWDVGDVDSAGDVGWYTSLAFDPSGNPAISYNDFTVPTQGNLRYARFNGVSWDITTVDYTGNNVGLYTSLAFDPSGRPAVSYFDDTGKDLKFARFDGGNWVKETIHNVGDVGAHTSLAFDASGNPAISYYDATNSVLKYARFNGSSWDITTVDSAGSVGRYTSLTFDPSGRPAISYYDFTTPSNGNLRYANFNGSSWDVTTVDVTGDVGLHTSLAFDASGLPAISYQGNDTLKYARLVPDTDTKADTTAAPTTTTPPGTSSTTTSTTTSTIISSSGTNYSDRATAGIYHLNHGHFEYAGADTYCYDYKHNRCLTASCW